MKGSCFCRQRLVSVVRFVKIAVVALVLSVGSAACQPTPLHHWSEADPMLVEEHGAETVQAYIDAYWVNEWTRAYWENYWAEVVAWSEAWERMHAAPPPCHSPDQSSCSVEGIEVCNGNDLPPCYVIFRESRFNPTAQNPRSSAYGLGQFIASTWRATCPEFPHRGSTVAQQAVCLARLWDWGRGASHWRLTL